MGKSNLLHTLIVCCSVLSAVAATAATDGAPFVNSDFSNSKSDSDVWRQCDSPYYRPLGTITPTAAGLDFRAAARPTLLETVKRIPLRPNDKVRIVLNADCAVGTRLYFGLHEYNGNTWQKNDVRTVVAARSGEQTIRVVLTATDAPNKTYNDATFAFGAAAGGVVRVRSIKAESAPAPEPEKPFVEAPKKGLLLHFDASNPDSIVLDEQRRVKIWKNSAGTGGDLKPTGRSPAPICVSGAWEKQNTVRFSGAEELSTQEPLQSRGLTVFVVFRRLPEQKGAPWQHLLYWDAGDRHGAAAYTLSTGSSGDAAEAKVHASIARGQFAYPLVVGSNGGAGGFLSGDIAEILVYDSADLPPEQLDGIREKLEKKWRISDSDYIRVGAIPAPPRRISDKLPLSDQQNQGEWTIVPELSDEFSGPLDRSKWLDMRHYTIGVAPTRTFPENVRFSDGKARLIAEYDPTLPSGRIRPRDAEYHSFTVGRLYSKNTFRYGYIEARAKVLPSSFNSAFWLYGVGKRLDNGARVAPEIDIFEIAGKSFAHTYNDNTALHFVESKPQRHVKFAGSWISPFKFTDDYHVYGLEWRPDRIRFYVDGSVVRDFKVEENHWDMPMRVHFDLMPHFEWFGVPDPSDFPGEFAIDYVRVWKNPQTTIPDDDWKRKYKWDYPAPDTGFAYDYLKKYGRDIVMTQESFDDGDGVSILKASPDGTGLTARNGARTGIAFAFPASVTRSESGGVQYAPPSPSWPTAVIEPPLLDKTDWQTYAYLAVDYFNPGFLQSCTLTVRNRDGVVRASAMLLKSGNGTFYWKLPQELLKAPIESLTFRIRGSDREQGFSLLDLRLEKE